MVTIRVPKTPARAYNTDRPVSSLLISQVERLQKVVLERIETEGQAAEYIRALTRRVQAHHPHIEAKRHGAKKSKSSAKKKKRKKPARRKRS